MTMEKEIKEISDYLNTTCSNNPAEIQERISVIMVYMMRTVEMLSGANKYSGIKRRTRDRP